MLLITVLGDELYNEETQEFTRTESVVLELEHSLVSLSKWESKWKKPFLGPKEKTEEEVLGYIEAMILTPNYPKDIVARMSKSNFEEINSYINSSESATTFATDRSGPPSREIITSELIYFWMTSYRIDWEAQHWHLSRLFNLVRICNVKNSKPKKMGRAEAAAQRKALNDQRRSSLGTTG